MCFRPILEKEASIFTAETAFLLTWAFLGRSSIGALRKMSFPCQVSCQAFSRERCKTAKVKLEITENWIFVSVRFPGTSIWGRRALDGCRLAPGAEGNQVADQDQEGDWKGRVSNELPAGGTAGEGRCLCQRLCGPTLQGHVSSEMEAHGNMS